MAGGVARKGGKKGRKIGRNKKKPSSMRYTAQRRWISNKLKRVTKNLGSRNVEKIKDWLFSAQQRAEEWQKGRTK